MSVCVFFDAKKNGLKKGQFKGLAGMGPWGWFLCCIFIWIIAFPYYLNKRPFLKQVSLGSSSSSISAQHSQPSLKDS